MNKGNPVIIVYDSGLVDVLPEKFSFGWLQDNLRLMESAFRGITVEQGKSEKGREEDDAS